MEDKEKDRFELFQKETLKRLDGALDKCGFESSKKAGRPTKITPETVGKLEDAFKHGLTVIEACYYSGISRDTFYSHFKSDNEFSDKMACSKAWLVMIAKHNIADAVLSGDLKQSALIVGKQMPINSDIYDEIPEPTEDDLDDERNRMKKFIDIYAAHVVEMNNYRELEKREIN